MEKGNRKNWIVTGALFVIFMIYTVVVKKVDIAAIGPEGSYVGFASINGLFRDAVPYNELLYTLSEFLGFVAIAVCVAFGFAGLVQLIKGRSFKKVDAAIYVLGGFYIVVMSFYALFEKVIINYRPIIMDEGLEASYPSSHTVLAVCVFASAIFEVGRYIKNAALKSVSTVICVIFTALTVVFRMLSGVHWLSDIMGGLILSAALIFLFIAADRTFAGKR